VARPNSFQTIYLDSSALIAVIQNEKGCDPIKQVLALADRRILTVYASPLILVEVRGQRRGENDVGRDRKALEIFDGRVTRIDLNRKVALRARQYVGVHRLKPPDAIHLASAVEAAVDIMWTLDKDFQHLWQTTVDGVWVDEPYEFGQQAFPGL
jgi:predicted nucleic acid-binding protein